MVASEIVLGLQTIASRKVSFSDEVVLSFGKITGGEVINALAKEVVIEGTLRTFNPSVREKVLAEIEHVATHIASAHHATARLEVTQGYPVLINDKKAVDHMVDVAHKVLGSQNVLERKPTADRKILRFSVNTCRAAIICWVLPISKKALTIRFIRRFSMLIRKLFLGLLIANNDYLRLLRKE